LARPAATKELEQEQTEETEAEKFCQECAILGNSTAERPKGACLVREPVDLAIPPKTAKNRLQRCEGPANKALGNFGECLNLV
jgi:hypothetical protein